MPVEPKPLFRPDIVRPHVAAFSLPEDVSASRAKLARWAHLLGGPEGERVKERDLLPVFLSDVLSELLGYRTLADSPERYTLSREQHVVVDGQYADAVLGEFGPGVRRFVVAVEDVFSGASILTREYARTVEPARTLGEQMLGLEEQIAYRVHEAYGLTSGDIELVQRTAPPRMPLFDEDAVADEIDEASEPTSSGI